MARKSRQDTRKRRGDYRKSRKANLRKNRRGGGWGFTGASSIPGTPGTVSNPQVFTAIGDCRAAEPGYWIPQGNYGKFEVGLPGMSGGKRRRGGAMNLNSLISKLKNLKNQLNSTTNIKTREAIKTEIDRLESLISMTQAPIGGKKSRKNRRAMKGGRYTFDLSQGSVDGVSPNAAPYWAGTYPPVQRIACEGSTPNPLNPGPHTPSTQPLPVASSALHLNPQSGGAAVNLAPSTYGVGDTDSMYYYAPTAGYDNKPSTWVDSVGAPVQLQIPYAARAMNPACLTTGHPPALTGALQKGGANPLQQIISTVADATKGTLGASGALVAGTASTMVEAPKALVGMSGGGGCAANPGAAVTGAVSTALQGVTGATTGLLSGATGATQAAVTGLATTAKNIGTGAAGVFQGGAYGNSVSSLGNMNSGSGAVVTEQLNAVIQPNNRNKKPTNLTITATTSAPTEKGAVEKATNVVSGAVTGALNTVTGAFNKLTGQAGGRRRNRKSRKNTRKGRKGNRKANRKNTRRS